MATATAGFRGETRHWWLHGFNSIYLLLLLTLLGIGVHVIGDPWLLLFPISRTEPAVLYLYVAVGAQVLVCVAGFVGVCAAHRLLLKLYWSAMAVAAVGDVLIGFVWAAKFYALHNSYDGYLRATTDRLRDDPRFEAVWTDVQSTLDCCGLRHANASHVSRGCPADARACTLPLLQWLHDQTDALFYLGYCVLFVMKLVFVVLFRRAQHRLLADDFFGRHRHLIGHWWASDAQDHKPASVVMAALGETDALYNTTVDDAPPPATHRRARSAPPLPAIVDFELDH